VRRNESNGIGDRRVFVGSLIAFGLPGGLSAIYLVKITTNPNGVAAEQTNCPPSIQTTSKRHFFPSRTPVTDRTTSNRPPSRRDAVSSAAVRSNERFRTNSLLARQWSGFGHWKDSLLSEPDVSTKSPHGTADVWQ